MNYSDIWINEQHIYPQRSTSNVELSLTFKCIEEILQDTSIGPVAVRKNG